MAKEKHNHARVMPRNRCDHTTGAFGPPYTTPLIAHHNKQHMSANMRPHNSNNLRAWRPRTDVYTHIHIKIRLNFTSNVPAKPKHKTQRRKRHATQPLQPRRLNNYQATRHTPGHRVSLSTDPLQATKRILVNLKCCNRITF